ncbi:acetyl-CoA carboxylase biotin carboxyl carrier protein [Blautia luti]|mgnify:FL=1|uniref:Biotin carboxyl carrier protein of acetyl-CoA carboxylase n=1 Tax=Blautia luti DSM 14534 = JCM 17040 TaxID=649762 RepID=A0A844GEA7_9FIRM|nr:acetyl-CoA carboxylase biotin carboxyl carrier protein [Blautia luti]MTD60313.1 acetyl-CoA carboxylase biotin carboxyl carrier protein [Blautia luti DSM 14534 = JCM 17040]RHQ93821.1 acetyl-CoA carboxylase biotin carboxyl carrier protein [Ruminococcus sp. AF21-42]BEI59940.1 acetyl-CoA carboxylase biotin carboxyl carrier protein [Blautia luti]
MDLEKIEGLVKIIEESSLNEFTYKDKDVKITMSKLDHPPVVAAGVPVAAPASAAVNTSVEAAEEEDDTLFITSPIVGTFYSAAAPDVPAFVKVGDQVKAGQTVCILEAMKLMNEIQSDYDCEIEAVLVSNEQKVEYGQPLFRVKKL